MKSGQTGPFILTHDILDPSGPCARTLSANPGDNKMSTPTAESLNLSLINNPHGFQNTISMYRVQTNKNPQSENNHITIMNTFWSTELNFRLILSHAGSICVSETRFDHFQSHKMEYRDKKSPQSKILESKTAREYSFLRSS